MVKRRGKEAGVQNCYPHRFRHTFADSWLAAGGNVDDLMNVAGWRSIAMPLRYAKGRGVARAAEAHKRLPGSAGRGTREPVACRRPLLSCYIAPIDTGHAQAECHLCCGEDLPPQAREVEGVDLRMGRSAGYGACASTKGDPFKPRFPSSSLASVLFTANRGNGRR